MSEGQKQAWNEGDRAKRSADQRFCYSCGTPHHITATSCPACGAVQAGQQSATEMVPGRRVRLGQPALREGMLIANQAFCRGCGAPIHERAPLCPQCGAPQMSAPSVGEKSKVVAAVLAFFLGGIGMHKFYLGEVGLGLIYVLFCWTFIPALIGMIEGIVYLCSSDESFARRYG